MRALLTLFFVSHICTAQTIFNIEGHFNIPLADSKFKNYQSGGGGGFGGGYRFNFSDDLSAELFGKALFSINGWESANLSVGKYTVRNDVFITTLGFKAIKKLGRISAYLGVNGGFSDFYSVERLRYPKAFSLYEDEVRHNTLFSNPGIQIGFNSGVRVKLFEQIDFEIGVSTLFNQKQTNYIDFTTYYHGENSIDYDIRSGKPTILLFNCGLVFLIQPENLFRNSSSFEIMENSPSPSGTPKPIHKKGKTPVSR